MKYGILLVRAALLVISASGEITKNLSFRRTNNNKEISLSTYMRQIEECASDVDCLGLDEKGEKCLGDCSEKALMKTNVPIPCGEFDRSFVDTSSTEFYFSLIIDIANLFGRTWQEFKCGFYVDNYNYYLGNEFLRQFLQNNDVSSIYMFFGEETNTRYVNVTLDSEQNGYGINGKLNATVGFPQAGPFSAQNRNQGIYCPKDTAYGMWFRTCNLDTPMGIHVIN